MSVASCLQQNLQRCLSLLFVSHHRTHFTTLCNSRVASPLMSLVIVNLITYKAKKPWCHSRITCEWDLSQQPQGIIHQPCALMFVCVGLCVHKSVFPCLSQYSLLVNVQRHLFFLTNSHFLFPSSL